MRDVRRSSLEQQGFLGVDDAGLARLNLPLRFTPALCMVAVGAGAALRSPVLMALLAAAAAAAAAGYRHPFDVLYNRAVRHLTGGPELPRNPAPRRFAFVMATPVLAASAIAFGVGAVGLGVLAACLQVAGCLSYVASGWCAGSYLHGRLFGPPRVVDPVRQGAGGSG